MNQQLTQMQIRATCRELLAAHCRVSGRRLCVELKRRFGAVGNTERVFSIWREETATSAVPADVLELKRQLAEAQAAGAASLARAQLAELREKSHQERWLMEIDRLRQQLQAQPNYAREVRTLQSTVTRLTVELAALRGAWPGNRAGEGGQD